MARYVAETEYENALIPLLGGLLKRNKKIHFLLVLETDIINFAPGKWCGNVKIGLKYFLQRWFFLNLSALAGLQILQAARAGLCHAGRARPAR